MNHILAVSVFLTTVVVSAQSWGDEIPDALFKKYAKLKVTGFFKLYSLL